ncbi:hypothetical protein C2S51_001425 [Perilla frutescens var. frutescens]|nr:hypothetical protein C2S51_001425 [Perilla frutescens var. frutescens]
MMIPSMTSRTNGTNAAVNGGLIWISKSANPCSTSSCLIANPPASSFSSTASWKTAADLPDGGGFAADEGMREETFEGNVSAASLVEADGDEAEDGDSNLVLIPLNTHF